MNTRRISFLLPVSVLFALVLLLASPVSALAQKPLDADKVDVLVYFAGAPVSADEAELSDSGGKVKKTYHIVPAVAASIPQSRIESLRRNPRVTHIEEDITVQITGQELPWGVDRMDAEIAHQSNKGTGVRVAILDTGIDLDHPDLKVAGSVSMLPEIPSADDDNGHGTLVAGIVGALDNDIGVVGVAPEAEIYAVKVLNCYGSGSLSAILAGIEWAVDNQMQVINMSIGSTMEWSQSVIEALHVAYNAGIVIIAGAGNGGNPEGTGDNIWAPARYEPVIAVGATNQADERFSQSCTGTALELVAPGVNVLSTAMDGGYSGISCTSASSPHVAGMAALLIASGITNNVAVRQALRTMTQDLGAPGWDAQYGWGIVNANSVGASIYTPATPAVSDEVSNVIPESTSPDAESDIAGDTTMSEDATVPDGTAGLADTNIAEEATIVEDTTTLQAVTVTVSKDSFLRGKGNNRNVNEGANCILVVGGGDDARSVVAFDLTGLQAGTLQKAVLVLNTAEPARNWVPDGSPVAVYRLMQEWVEGNGCSLEERGEDRERGSGAGVTWNSAADADIADRKTGGGYAWDGGWAVAKPATTPGVAHTSGMTGEVVWDVTDDVLSALDEGAVGVTWLVKKDNEVRNGEVQYFSREGADAAGTPELAPRLILNIE